MRTRLARQKEVILRLEQATAEQGGVDKYSLNIPPFHPKTNRDARTEPDTSGGANHLWLWHHGSELGAERTVGCMGQGRFV